MFWKAGYAATSLDDLSAATGMNRPSLYAAFGDKRDLYLKTLERYSAEARDETLKALADNPTLRVFLKRFYDKALDLYFERHDGQACTIEDWLKVFEDVSGRDLAQFKLWYSQAGTPKVKARVEHDPASHTARVQLSQTIPATPGQSDKQPMLLPFKTAPIGAESGASLGEERLILLDRPEEEVTFEGVTEPPILSINRDFSAPVLIDVERKAGELDPKYQYGGIDVAWGRFYEKLPWPKRDRKKAEEHLRKVLTQINPNNLRARVFLADTLAHDKRAAEAKRLLEEVMAAPAGKYDAPEERRAKALATGLLPEVVKAMN